MLRHIRLERHSYGLTSTCFPVHPTTQDPPNHSGVYGFIGCFQPTMWGPRGLLLGSMILVMPVLGLQINSDQLENEVTS